MILYNFPQDRMGEKCIQVDKCIFFFFFFFFFYIYHLTKIYDAEWKKTTTTTHIQFEIFIADKFNFPF